MLYVLNKFLSVIFSLSLSLSLVVLGFGVSYCLCDDWNVWTYFIS